MGLYTNNVVQHSVCNVLAIIWCPYVVPCDQYVVIGYAFVCVWVCWVRMWCLPGCICIHTGLCWEQARCEADSMGLIKTGRVSRPCGCMCPSRLNIWQSKFISFALLHTSNTVNWAVCQTILQFYHFITNSDSVNHINRLLWPVSRLMNGRGKTLLNI